MRKILDLSYSSILLMILFGTASVAVSQTVQPLSLNLGYTYHLFKRGDSATRLEIAYSFPDRSLTFKPSGKPSELTGKLEMFIRLENMLTHTSDSDEWYVEIPKSVQDTSIRMLEGIRNLTVVPGKYRAWLGFRDGYNTSRSDSVQFDLNISLFASKRIGLSDIEIASELKSSANIDDVFYKNGYRVVPNIFSEIVAPNLVLNTYTEVYNMHTIPASEYSVMYLLADSTGKVINELELKHARPSGRSMFEVNELPVDKLPSGRYYLVMKLFNGPIKSATDSVKTVRMFTVFNSEYDAKLAKLQKQIDSTTAKLNEIDSLYENLTEKQLDEEYLKMKCIVPKPAQDIWKSLKGDKAKATFMTKFWQLRDPSPGTPLNEDRDDFYKRLRTAELQYKSAQTPRGWDSDRGRILLQYGTPDNVERHYQDQYKKPYEIWKYTSRSMTFVFVDRPQSGNYTIVHSDVQGEVQNPNWEREYVTLVRETDFNR